MPCIGEHLSGDQCDQEAFFGCVLGGGGPGDPSCLVLCETLTRCGGLGPEPSPNEVEQCVAGCTRDLEEEPELIEQALMCMGAHLVGEDGPA